MLVINMEDDKSSQNVSKDYLITLMINNIDKYNQAMSSSQYEMAFKILKECIGNFYPELQRKKIKDDNIENTYYYFISNLLKEAENKIFSVNKNKKDDVARVIYTEELKQGVELLFDTHCLLIECMYEYNTLLPIVDNNEDDQYEIAV